MPNMKRFSELIELIPATLEIEGEMNREELSKYFSRPRTTIFDYLKELIDRGIVTKHSVRNNRKGRPKIYYRLPQ